MFWNADGCIKEIILKHNPTRHSFILPWLYLRNDSFHSFEKEIICFQRSWQAVFTEKQNLLKIKRVSSKTMWNIECYIRFYEIRNRRAK